jgi:hypothetical protein
MMGSVCSTQKEKKSNDSTKPSEEMIGIDEQKDKNIKIIAVYRQSKVARKI